MYHFDLDYFLFFQTIHLTKRKEEKIANGMKTLSQQTCKYLYGVKLNMNTD